MILKVSVIVLTFLFIEVYDGLRLRTLPVLYKALQSGTDDDRMKGALWTLNISALGEHPKHGIFGLLTIFRREVCDSRCAHLLFAAMMGYLLVPENQPWRPNISSAYLVATIMRKWVLV